MAKNDFLIWRMELLHPAMWHDHGIDFASYCTLQCGMWVWNHDSEFTKWQHTAVWYVALGWHAVEFARWQQRAMWHVALGSWHWIRQVAAPCNVAGGSGLTRHWFRPKRSHIGILHLVSILTISPHSTCHSAPAEKNDVMSISKMADLRQHGFYGSNNGFFEKLMYDFL